MKFSRDDGVASLATSKDGFTTTVMVLVFAINPLPILQHAFTTAVTVLVSVTSASPANPQIPKSPASMFLRPLSIR